MIKEISDLIVKDMEIISDQQKMMDLFRDPAKIAKMMKDSTKYLDIVLKASDKMMNDSIKSIVELYKVATS